MNGEELKSRILHPMDMDTGMIDCSQRPNLEAIVKRLHEKAEMLEICVSKLNSAVRVIPVNGGCECGGVAKTTRPPLTLYELLDEIDGKFTQCVSELDCLADALRDELGECKILG